MGNDGNKHFKAVGQKFKLTTDAKKKEKKNVIKSIKAPEASVFKSLLKDEL